MVMKKNKILILSVAVIILLIIIIAFSRNKKQEYTDAMQAVYLEKEDGNSIFVNLEAEYPFHGTVPEDAVYDESGKKITPDDLNNGDVVDIYGNGMIAESYPAQYHGITEIRRIEQANQEYIRQYGYYLDELFIEKDPSERPYLNVCYTDELAAVSVMIPEPLSYKWTYEENGESNTITTDVPHILQTSPVEVKNFPNRCRWSCSLMLCLNVYRSFHGTMRFWDRDRMKQGRCRRGQLLM